MHVTGVYGQFNSLYTCKIILSLCKCSDQHEHMSHSLLWSPEEKIQSGSDCHSASSLRKLAPRHR